MSILTNLVMISIFLLIGAGIILLQVYLSRLPGKFPGLILPILSFVLSLVIVVSAAAYTAQPQVSHSVMRGDGTIIETQAPKDADPLTVPSFGARILAALPGLLWMNIPTIILLGIYFAVRGSQKQKRKSELNRMDIADLE